MPQVSRYEGGGSQYERTGQIDRPGPYAQLPHEQIHGGQVPGYQAGRGPGGVQPLIRIS